ncbi:uncharacterized protein MEPE_04627 [Melanopsichium pennsylvanicum]|uniref:Uncharacterized protein n=2 Tax=Melanopsichium pennsylvanicum TaxID=63383 RepID=A0AAJ5C6V9_9BASI|nr:conserved hypothetical protein [Melanopsichium pennsylvanicum 4]SNX85918.1 uncharacterized protein MEPE_04627 [Melanopsichium pennsylvanicum]
MGVSAVIRGGFGFLLDRQHHVSISSAPTINITPANALQSLFRRQREAPLPITPPALFRSMLQCDDLQALLWAWTLVGILVLFAFWTNPSEASFRPFLTDLVFRERLRLLNDQDSAGQASIEPSTEHKPDPNAFSSLLSTASYSSGPFALTFGSKVALSVRTPPFHRKDLGLLSIVTISQSMPTPTVHRQRTSTAHGSSRGHDFMDCTSLFIGAFGKWWVLGFGIPDLPTLRTQSNAQHTKPGREALEENLNDVTDWGVLEMRSIDPEPQSRRSPAQISNGGVHELVSRSQSRKASGVESSVRTASPAPTPTRTVPETDNEDCLSITALVSRSQSDVADLQEQLTQVRSASTRACEALEGDLEEVRAKKKEEEKSRSDIKTRTRALDDSKRQVESGRREAERRLKAANATRALRQASIQQRKEQIDMLNKRRATIVAKKGTNAEKRLQKSEDLSLLISQAKDKAGKLRGDIDDLRHEVEAAQHQLQLEKMNARNAQENDFVRDHGRMEQQPYTWNPAMDMAHVGGHEAMYAHLASNQDPLVDSLARLEQYALAEHRFTTSPFDVEASLPINKMPNVHADAYADLGTSVLRNAFRRANAAAAADGREMVPSTSQGLVNPSLQNASNFEAIKQAFQPTVATEEDGRRSWSAFDVWQSDLRSGSRQGLQWASNGGNASADSLPQISASSGLLPLDRSTSDEQTGIPNLPNQADGDQLRNMSKVKRAFRWPFRPSQVQDDLV